MLDHAVTLGDAITQHYVAHGLPADGGVGAPWFQVRAGPVTIRLPNPPARKRALFYHDSNHVLTGYNTVFSEGEMVIAGFELGNGCGRYWIAWAINLGMFALGLVACSRPMFEAFVRGRRASSIYERSEDRDILEAMTVREIKTLLRPDLADGTANGSDRLRFAGFAVAAVTAYLVALVVVVALLRSIAQIL